MRLTRESVLKGAFTILDSYGLGDLTMRRLAAALGVQPGGLYWHFANKQTLLAAMADEIVAGMTTDTGTDGTTDSDADDPGRWRASLTAITDDFRTALLQHRDGAELVAAGYALRPGSGQPAQTMIKVIERAGIEPEQAGAAATALVHFVLGHTAEVQAHDQLRRLGGLPEQAEPAPDPERAFRTGLEIFLDGLQQRVDQR